LAIRAKSCVALALFGALVGVCALPAKASTDQICDHAANNAAKSSGVPLPILRAITRTETGRSRGGEVEPWPWTVNMEGAGKWFASEASARAYVERHYSRGARVFDVGCFQINYRWHGTEFASIDEMFDPIANAEYAAGFLMRLYNETGDWTAAVGAYHSRTPKFAERYIRRFERIRRALNEAASQTVEIAAQAPTERANLFPFLQTMPATYKNSSLVPLGAGRPALINLDGGS